MADSKGRPPEPEGEPKGAKGPEIVRVHCNRCGWETRHEIKYEGKTDFPDYEDGELTHVELIRSRVLACMGCETTTFEEAWTIWGQYDQNGNEWWESQFLPDRTVGRRKPDTFADLSDNLERVYKEVLSAFNHGQRLLCAIGLRALIEGICADLEVVPTTPKYPKIYHKIEGLKKRLPESLVNNLHSFRFMGNWVAHELGTPKHEDLDLAIEVIEDLMNFLYNLDYKASRLHRRPGWNKESSKETTESPAPVDLLPAKGEEE